MAHELTHTIQQSGQNSKAQEKGDNLSHSPVPSIMRSLLFDSTLKVQYRLLESREFEVSKGAITVVASADWVIDGGPQGWTPPNYYNISLHRKNDYWLDDNLANCEFEVGKTDSKIWPGFQLEFIIFIYGL